MEYGHGREDQADFAAYGGEVRRRHSTGSPRDWFASDKFAATDHESSDQLMEEYPPATNENHYNPIYHDHQQQQNSAQPAQTLGIDYNGEQICNIQKEHMFEKVVTPSDVGKLNRLVIPKQHAEKYFPLDTSSNEKGLLLNFEDLTGKAWRFRYSYWNSSQSYVMTKGWSRFVKEKKLDAGDIVSFQRGANDKHRLFIDWRRRPAITHQLPVDMTSSHFHNQYFYRSNGGILPSWSPFLFSRSPPISRVHPAGINFQVQNPSMINYYDYTGYGNGNHAGQVMSDNASVVYITTTPEMRVGRRMVQAGMGGGAVERIPLVFESIPVVQGKKRLMGSGVAKRLRLFGVNMECPVSSDTSTSDEFEMMSSSIPLNSPTANPHLNQCLSSPALMLPSSTTRYLYNGASISNEGNNSMSLDLEI